jgi:class III poly(R)-hydroxyalkanoic acid synthase PhaE subunit
MTEFAESSNAWTSAWLDMQKQYMDVWLKLSQQKMPFPQQKMPWQAAVSPFAATGGNPWADAFEQWSKLFGQSMPKDARDVSTRLFDLGKSYLGMSERFWQLLRQGKDACTWAGEWQESMQDALKQFGQGYGFPGGGTDPWSGFANLWGLPMSNWQRMACAFSPFPGEMEKALREGRVPEASEMTRAARHFQSVPPVGYTREWQEQLQDWTRLSAEYIHALQDFSALLGKVLQRALELFGARVTEKVSAGESFDGLRAMYDLWIDCGEEAYAEQVASKEFPHLQSELVNALMRMKRHEQMMVEEVMTGLNIPTRREMDTTHKRVYDLQQQMRRLQDRLEEAAESEAGSAAAMQAAPAAQAASTPQVTPAPRKQATAHKKAAPQTTHSTAKHLAKPKTRKG